MRRGVWHQCGANSQKVAQEQLEAGCGVGVVISARDLSFDGASTYAEQYKATGAAVLLDQQFYKPDFVNKQTASYPLAEHRATISSLGRADDSLLDGLASSLEVVSRAVGVEAVLAPAVIYQAGRNDIIDLNARLFQAAKRAGDAIGIPTYASVVLGRSVTAAPQTLNPLLSTASSLAADGWYYAFEFEPERLPSSQAAVLRCLRSGLTLASTGKPLLHAFAGPLGILSHGFGATAAAIGQSQNTWRFDPDRWEPPAGQGGGGNAPARFFSSALWGTIVHPDEIVRLTPAERAAVLTLTPFSQPVGQIPPGDWSRWDANKHLVFKIGEVVQTLAALPTARDAANRAIQLLDDAVTLHGTIAGRGVQLADNTAAYQASWRDAMRHLVTNDASDFDYLEFIS